jgi:hypothetical protein
MSPDPNKKTPRSFQCRESLWQKFEQMARELECSVDYLINDAMKQYARQRGYSGSARQSDHGSIAQSMPSGAAPARSPAPALEVSQSPEAHHATSGSGAHHLTSGSGAHHVTSGSGARPNPLPNPIPSGAAPPPYSAPPYNGAGSARTVKAAAAHAPPPIPAVPPPAPPAPGAKRVGAPHNLAAPPPIPGVPSMMPPTPPPIPGRLAPPPRLGGATFPGIAAQRTLTVRYQGQLYPVNKDHFIIGRGKQTSDLTIKDPNVSRQHAVVEFANGQYIISDLGSTNGIEYQGQRVQRRAIVDGDVVKICDHELLFSFR